MTDDGLGIKSSERTIKEHLRRYYSYLQSSQEFLISSLFDSYRNYHPSLHKFADSNNIDISVLCYCLPRLPQVILKTKKIFICQDLIQLKDRGIDINSFEKITALARRRLNYFDSNTGLLIVMVTSDSDIDDLINTLIAFQIERQKFASLSLENINQLQQKDDLRSLGIDQESWIRLKGNLGENWKDDLLLLCQYNDLVLTAISFDSGFYSSTISTWWQKISTESLIFEFAHTPIYFISSNLHSVLNLIGGYVNHTQDKIITFIESTRPDLYLEWQKIKEGQNQLRVIDFLYYVSSVYFASLQNERIAKTNYEEAMGIKTIKSDSCLMCNAQLIPVSSIVKSGHRDPNLIINNQVSIINSRAYILNIDYPLGFSAYYILKELLTTLINLKGVYIIGKAAILSGEVGDIQIPKIVFDERTNNIFYPKNIFNNNFSLTAFSSAILKDQKSISVHGTFLENSNQLQNYIQSGFNIIEMETGPYLSAMYQKISNSTNIPRDTVAHLDNLSFDVGIINYASDNPLSKNLGEGSLALKGIEPTYLATLSVVQRIIDLESV